MNNSLTKARLSLFIGILFISIFPILIKMELASGLISAFYRMGIATVVLLPIAFFTKKIQKISIKNLLLSILCGCIFASDVTFWNISIQQSTATQATLLTNLSPVWVGILSLIFLKNRPSVNFWIGVIISLIGLTLLIGIDVFISLSFDTAFILGVFSGILYSIYFLVSKRVLNQVDVITFISYSTLSSSVFLYIISFIFNEQFIGYSNYVWFVFIIQGLLCQLAAWLLLGYAIKHLRTTRVSVSMLGQAVLTAVLATFFLGEEITTQTIIGGLIILLGVFVTFRERPLLFKKNSYSFKNNKKTS